MATYHFCKTFYSCNSFKKMFLASAGILIFSASTGFSESFTYDTICLTLQKAESLFVEKNVQLLAQKCNVDAARAQVLQIQLWDNPNITVNQSVYNTESPQNGANKWFPVSNNGETSLQIQQIVTVAGKRNKRIRLAELTAQKTEYLFYDLLRTLKYQLRSNFYTLYFTQKTLAIYTKEIESLAKLIGAFDEQYQKGHVSKKELLRLKASLFLLQNEKLTLDNQLIDTRSDFSLLLRLSRVCPVAIANADSFDSLRIDSLRIENLEDTALLFRNDLKAACADVNYNKLNVEYQKSLAVSDFSLIGGWDKNGSYVHNYNYMGIQIDLPFFNRNQGNIKSAIASCQSSEYVYQNALDVVKNDVSAAYAKALQCDMLYKNVDKSFSADFSAMQEEVLKNYEKRNLSLLEFLDFYDAYKQNAIQYNTLRINRANAFEGINFSVGKNLIAW